MNVLYASADQRQHLEAIFKRAATDAQFRRHLIQEPKQAFQEVTGVRLPDTYNIQFIETPKGVDAVVPLPVLIDEDSSLTEEELEVVAGGMQDEAEWCCGCSQCTNCSQTI